MIQIALLEQCKKMIQNSKCNKNWKKIMFLTQKKADQHN